MNRSPRRRQALRALVVAVGLVLATSASGTASAANNPDRRPNVVIVYIDDLGWKDLGCTGSDYYRTPHIDRLAKRGVRFTQAYATAPVCSPSRAAFYSGRYTTRTLMTEGPGRQAAPADQLFPKTPHRRFDPRSLPRLPPERRLCLHPDEVTFAERLRDAGYRTGFLGKWHCGWDASQWPDKQGFDFAEAFRTMPATTSGHYGRDFTGLFDAPVPGLADDDYLAEVLTDRAIHFVENNREEPFLLVLSHYLVHAPLVAEKEKLARWRGVPTTDQDNPIMAAMIESVDDSVGRLAATLDRLGLSKDTVVIFTSDNGGYHRATSTHPLLGTKAMPYEGAFRVPLIVSWPGRFRSGEVDPTPNIQIDLHPTILEVAGLSPDTNEGTLAERPLDGVSLVPLLTRGEAPPLRPLYFFFPHYSGVGCTPFAAIRERGWKLYRFFNDPKGVHQLFNLDSDPHEQNEASTDHPAVVERLAAQLQAWLADTGALLPPPNPAYVPSVPSGSRGGDTYREAQQIREKSAGKRGVIKAGSS